MFRQLGPAELIIILLIVLLLFGAKKLPDTARGLGRSMRIFKAETKGLRDDDEAPDTTAAPAPRAVESQPAEPRPTTPGDPVADSAPSRAPESERTDR
ncbi:MAG TPA: Sec-independent protein translocase subunit TatA [Jiangellales bacterium]|nr:Sec-independent protein translocase subunit TatA [Jiangellales bacterium]